MLCLFLDDERDPSDVTWVPGFDHTLDWEVVRSFDEACAFVKTVGVPDVVSFDHDLGLGKTGLDFAKWLIEYDLDYAVLKPGFAFTVHSMNPVGRENIRALVQSYICVRFGHNTDQVGQLLHD